MKLVRAQILKTCIETRKEGIIAGNVYNAELDIRSDATNVLWIGNCVFDQDSYKIIEDEKKKGSTLRRKSAGKVRATSAKS